VAVVTSAIYPNGTSSPSAAGADCRIYRGWPNATALDADLRVGTVNVTIFPVPGQGRVTTRYLEAWRSRAMKPTLSTAVSGVAVTFSGTAEPGQLAGLRVNDNTYVYATVSGDTPDSVAANLAVQARSASTVLLSGAMLTVPGAWKVDARVVAQAPAMKQVRRQLHNVQITCWCPTPAIRDATASAIDQSLAALSFIALPDQTQGRLTYNGTAVFDQSQDALLYRRDLIYSVEYPTTISELQPPLLWGQLGFGAATVPA
jgi:hypothetical protein